MGPGARVKSQSRLSRSRLDPAWSLQECRWAPCVRGHDPGQGQLPCESYRPPGQLLETHPAALLADTYALFAKNQSTLRRGGPRVQHGGPPRAKCVKSGLCDGLGGDHLPALPPVLRQLPSPAQPASLAPSTSARIGERSRQAQAETGMAPATIARGLQVGSIGIRAMLSQAIGAPALSAACAGGKALSQSAAMKRLAFTDRASADSSQSSGGTMIAGLSIFSRFAASPTSGVSVTPPGTNTLAVTPLPARSAASTAIADSAAALEEP